MNIDFKKCGEYDPKLESNLFDNLKNIDIIIDGSKSKGKSQLLISYAKFKGIDFNDFIYTPDGFENKIKNNKDRIVVWDEFMPLSKPVIYPWSKGKLLFHALEIDYI